MGENIWPKQEKLITSLFIHSDINHCYTEDPDSRRKVSPECRRPESQLLKAAALCR